MRGQKRIQRFQRASRFDPDHDDLVRVAFGKTLEVEGTCIR